MLEADEPDARNLAKRVDTLPQAEVAKVQAGSPADWANEAHGLAIEAYAAVGAPEPHQTIEVPDGYVKKERPVIEMQLERAGLRLAALLNTALK